MRDSRCNQCPAFHVDRWYGRKSVEFHTVVSSVPGCCLNDIGMAIDEQAAKLRAQRLLHEKGFPMTTDLQTITGGDIGNVEDAMPDILPPVVVGGFGDAMSALRTGVAKMRSQHARTLAEVEGATGDLANVEKQVRQHREDFRADLAAGSGSNSKNGGK